MTSRERIFTALEGKQPDRVPILEWIIDPKVIKGILPGASYADFAQEMGLDAVATGEVFDYRAGIGCTLVDERNLIVKDKWGVIRKITTEIDAFPIDSPIKSEKDLNKYTPPDVDKQTLGELPNLVKKFKGKKAIIWTMNDAFQIPWYLRGMENILIDMVKNPHLVERLVQIASDYNVKLAQRAIRAGAEVIMLGDDYALKSGPLMSPAHFERFFLPGLRRIVGTIKEAGVCCVKHCDGDIWSIIDMIVDTGVDAINPLEPVAGMDIEKVKKRYGDKVCLIGNIDCGYILSQAAVEEAIKNLKETIPKAAWIYNVI